MPSAIPSIPMSFRGAPKARTRNPDASSGLVSGFRVPTFGRPRDDGALCHHHASSQHLDQAMQRLGRDLLVLNQRDADVAFARIFSVGAVAREIMPRNDAQAPLA